MASSTSVKLVLPSDVKLIDLAHSACEKMAEIAGFDSDEALNLGLAVREAVINAMVHGNGQDPGLQVDVTLTVGEDGLTARIVDHGDGFDPSQAADPTSPENLLRTSGRGLLLINAFVDEVKFDRGADGGTEITLIKKPGTGDDDNNGSS